MIGRDRFTEILNERKCPYKISGTGRIMAYVPRHGAKYWKYLPDMPDYATVLVACDSMAEARYIRLLRECPGGHDICLCADVGAGRDYETPKVRAFLAIDFEAVFDIENTCFISKDLYLCLLRQFRDMINDRITSAQAPPHTGRARCRGHFSGGSAT